MAKRAKKVKNIDLKEGLVYKHKTMIRFTKVDDDFSVNIITVDPDDKIVKITGEDAASLTALKTLVAAL